MKKIIIIIFLGILAIGQLKASDWKVQLIENDMGYLELQMRCTNPAITPTTASSFNGMVFQIYWPTSYNADIQLLCSPSINTYNINDAWGYRKTTGASHWREFYMSPAPYLSPENWVTGEWVTMTTFEVNVGTGTGDFNVAADGMFNLGLVLNYGAPNVDYFPDVEGTGATNYTYPTVIYDYVWTGAVNNWWDMGNNWKTQCGTGAATGPGYGSNCYIPAGTTNLPTGFGGFFGTPSGCNNLRIATGVSFTLPAVNNMAAPITYLINGNFDNYGQLTISPDAALTVVGDTYLDGAESLVIASNGTSTGSFIDNGVIDYGAGGSAKVQTYVENNAVAPAFFMHFIAPTVKDMDVIDFNLSPNSTYAYGWDQPGSQWVNVYTPYAVAPGTGLALSTIDGADYTLNAVGELSTGLVASPVGYGGVGNLNLIGNPYPSAIDFDALAAVNPTVYNQYYLWNPAGGAYLARTTGGGTAPQYIQVGQGFFVTTVSASGNVNFHNAERSHSNVVFRDMVPNVLELTAQGVGADYYDKTQIRFYDGATNGYDLGLDADHWNSWYTDATQLRTIAEDGSKLTVNMLPPLDLNGGQLVSVPMQFSCGYAGEYTITASQLESFDNGAEIWLEDKQNNDIWVNIGTNPVYTFNATPDDLADRFVVHFFGPTGIDDTYDPGINIFSYEHNAYVTTVGTEQITDITVYDLSGRIAAKPEISAGQHQYKIYVSERKSYYVVRVTTDKNVFTRKVFIY